MRVREIPLDELKADPRNARSHGRSNLEAIKRSLAAFGQQKPIVVDCDGIVRAGNGTLAAAHELGWTTLRAVVTDLSGAQAAAYAVADNRTAELADWDQAALAQLLAELRADEAVDHLATGFDDQQIRALLDAVNPDTGPGVPELFQVLAECDDAGQQQRVYELLRGAGVRCRVITL